MPRPQYDKKMAPKDEDEEEDENGAASEDDDEEAESPKDRGKLDKFKMKKNHEATSDEDEE